jgi:hypothetical protein
MRNIQFKEEWKNPALGAFVGFAAGVSFGYFLCAQRLKKMIDVAVEEVIVDEYEEEIVDGDQLRRDFNRAAQEIQQWTGFTTLKDLPVGDRRGVEELLPTPKPEVDEPAINVILRDDIDWDQEEEEAERSPDAPYVIHRDEFHNSQTGYKQVDLTWFAGDQVLVDDKMVPIYNDNETVGRLEFGRGSGESDVVYIRNPVFEGEYMVTRSPNSYQVEVLGLQAEEEAEEGDLKHSNQIPKFRQY